MTAQPALKPRHPSIQRRRDGNAEARIQAAVIEWIRWCAPQTVVFAIPNGGLRGKAEAARLRWTGVLAGVPDLAVLAPRGRAFFLEVKTPDGRLSLDQREMFDRLVALGHDAAIVRCVEDVRAAFSVWGIATREAA
jgi:hypothetical protein